MPYLYPVGAAVGGYIYGAFIEDDGFTWTKASLIAIAAFGTLYLVKK